MSYARRYAEMAWLDLGADDDDGQAASHPKETTRQQPQKPKGRQQPAGKPKKSDFQQFGSGPSITDDLPQAEQLRLEAVLKANGEASQVVEFLNGVARSPANQLGNALKQIEGAEKAVAKMDGNTKSALTLVIHRARLRLLKVAMKGIVSAEQLAWMRKEAEKMDDEAKEKLLTAADETEKRQAAEASAPEGLPY